MGATYVPVVWGEWRGQELPVVDVKGLAIGAAVGPLDGGLVTIASVGRPKAGDQVGVGGVAVALEGAAGEVRLAHKG